MFKRFITIIIMVIINNTVYISNLPSIAFDNNIFADNVDLKDPFIQSKYYKKAIKALENKDINKLIEYTNNLVKDFPKDAKLKYFLGKMYLENNFPDKALELYNQSIDLNKAYKPAYIAKVEYLISKNNYQEAINTLNLFMDLNSKDELLLYNLANLYGLNNEYDKAIDNFNKLLILNENNFNAYKGLGFSYKKKNDIDNAIINFKKSLSYNQDPEIIDELGLCYVSKGDFITAIGYFSRANSINPNNSTYLYHQAIAYIKADDYKSAYSVVKVLMEKFPNDVNAKELLIYLADRIYGSEDLKKKSKLDLTSFINKQSELAIDDKSFKNPIKEEEKSLKQQNNNVVSDIVQPKPEDIKDLLTYKDNILYQSTLSRAINLKKGTIEELSYIDSLEFTDVPKFVDKDSLSSLNEDIFSNYYLGKSTTTPAIKSDDLEDTNKQTNILEKLATLKPDNNKVKLALAQNYFKNQEFDKSSKLLLEYLNLNPDDKSANILLATLYCKLSDYEKAELQLDKVQNLVKDDSDFFKQVGYLNFLVNRYDTAITYFKKYLQVDPDDVTANLLVIYSLDKQGHKKEAVNQLEQLSVKYPDNISILRGKAVMLVESKQFNKAIETIDKLLSLNEREKNAYFILEQVYLLQSDFENALKVLEKYTNIFPLDDEGYFHIANVYARENNLSQALANYKKAVDLDPENSYYHYVLGAAYLETGDKELAMKEYDIIKSLNKGYIEEFKEFLN